MCFVLFCFEQYATFLHNQWTSYGSFWCYYSNYRKYQYEVVDKVCKVLLFCSKRFMNSKKQNYSKSLRTVYELGVSVSCLQNTVCIHSKCMVLHGGKLCDIFQFLMIAVICLVIAWICICNKTYREKPL